MSGFERGDYSILSDLHREIREKFTYLTDQDKHGLVERWDNAPTLKNIGRTGVTRFVDDSGNFSLVSLDKVRVLGYNARLVICYTETGVGHVICEVASSDYAEAYFFDNRQIKIAVLNDLVKYRFVAVSPWNPQPTDERPWLKVKT